MIATATDWRQELRFHNIQTMQWLERIHGQPISRDEFVRQWLALPHHAKKTSRRRPVRTYHYLKKRYGFFKGGTL